MCDPVTAGFLVGMNNTATFRRGAAAIGLLTTALLTVPLLIFSSELPGESSERLAAIDAAGAQGMISAFAFVLAQLPFLVSVLGIGHLLRERAPVLSNLGTSMAVIGAFGHSVGGGISLVHLSMAADVPNRAVHAEVMESVESGPAVAFMMMGFLGTVLGILLLAIGLWRARVGPRWVGPVLAAFLVIEFVGAAVSEWTAPLAAILYLVAFITLAATVWRSPEADWTAGAVDVARSAR